MKESIVFSWTNLHVSNALGHRIFQLLLLGPYSYNLSLAKMAYVGQCCEARVSRESHKWCHKYQRIHKYRLSIVNMKLFLLRIPVNFQSPDLTASFHPSPWEQPIFWLPHPKTGVTGTRFTPEKLRRPEICSHHFPLLSHFSPPFLLSTALNYFSGLPCKPRAL